MYQLIQTEFFESDFKKVIPDNLKKYAKNKIDNLILNPIYKNRFDKYLNTYTREYISQYIQLENTGITGVYEFINLQKRN